MELLVTNENHFARSHMWFKHGEKLEHIVAKYLIPFRPFPRGKKMTRPLEMPFSP